MCFLVYDTVIPYNFMKKTITEFILYTLLFSLCLSPLIFLAGCASGNDEKTYEEPVEIETVRHDVRYIVHAAGRLTGVDSNGVERTFDGSNSAEGLELCRESGANVIELDFNFTSDGQLVCIHDWSSEYSDDITTGEPLTLDEFLETKIFWNFTPLWIGDVVDYLRENDGTYIVTDIKDDNIAGLTAIAQFAPDMVNRFIPQIYSADEYDLVRELGFDYVIYTLYRLDWKTKTNWRALGGFAATHPLVGFTFAYELCDVEDFTDGMKKSGVPLFVHTVNDPEEQQKYFDMGIGGVYTDIVPENSSGADHMKQK